MKIAYDVQITDIRFIDVDVADFVGMTEKKAWKRLERQMLVETMVTSSGPFFGCSVGSKSDDLSSHIFTELLKKMNELSLKCGKCGRTFRKDELPSNHTCRQPKVF